MSNLRYSHLGYFVFRTPLLPVEALGVANDSATLRDAFSTPVLRESLYVASPALFGALSADAGEKQAARIDVALRKYLWRMCTVCTPFGLFAGISLGTIGARTNLKLSARAQYQPKARLDFSVLFRLLDKLRSNTEIMRQLRYFPNPTLYRTGSRIRYFERETGDAGVGSYSLASLEDSPHVDAVLQRAASGARWEEMIAPFLDTGSSAADADAFVTQLITGQVIVPSLDIPLTGQDPLGSLIDQLKEVPAAASLLADLRDVHSTLDELNANREQRSIDGYRSIEQTLDKFDDRIDDQSMVQVDLLKPADGATLSTSIIHAVSKAVDILWSISPAQPQGAELTQFAARFFARYGERAVSLLEALDPEAGIGFSGDINSSRLVEGLPFDREMTPAFDGARSGPLGRLVARARHDGAVEIVLSADELKSLSTEQRAPLADSICAFLQIEKGDSETDATIYLKEAHGPTSARLLGRFCYLSDALSEHVKAALRQEASFSDAVFAEIVHLSEDAHIENVMYRPVLRDFEISCIGTSGAAPDKQIPLTDLLLKSAGDTVILLSKRLGRRVVPRNTTAHNFQFRSPGVYKLLSMLQLGGTQAVAAWDWGPFAALEFLPRVRVGNVIVSLARWRLTRQDIDRLTAEPPPANRELLLQLRASRSIPRWVTWGDAQQASVFDLENPSSTDLFIELIKKRPTSYMTELFPNPGKLVVTGPEGGFNSELVLPLQRAPEPRPETRPTSTPTISHGARGEATHRERTFYPGSEWLYFKIYGGRRNLDRVLIDTIGPVVSEALNDGLIGQWFFIRYEDPDPHLRIRVHGKPDDLLPRFWPRIVAALATVSDDALAWKVQLDTYERECERYGGVDGMAICETAFCNDSASVLTLLQLSRAHDWGDEERWQLALRGTDILLTAMGYDTRAKAQRMKQLRDAFGAELHVDHAFRSIAGKKYRDLQETLVSLVRDGEVTSNLRQETDELFSRSYQQWSAVKAELSLLDEAGRLDGQIDSIVASLIHMHVNRVVIAQSREHELMIYNFLARIYELQLATDAQ